MIADCEQCYWSRQIDHAQVLADAASQHAQSTGHDVLVR